MSKWILIIALALGGFLVWKFGIALKPGGNSSDNPFVQHVPADTVMYSGGEYNEELLKMLAPFYAMPLAPSQMEQIKMTLGAMDADMDESAGVKFFQSIVKQFSSLDDVNVISGMEAAGIATSGYYAFYAHGAVPVLRMTTSDNAKLIAMLDQAVADSGLSYTQNTIGDADVRQWQLTKDDEEQHVYFVLALEGSLATATFFSSKDDNAIKQERLGQTALAESIASGGQLSVLQTKYGFNDFGISLFSLENLVNGLLDVNANGLSKDLVRYLPEEAQQELYGKTTDVCKKEFGALIKTMPRFISGYTDLSVKNDRMVAKGDFIWELNSEPVKTELAKMRGHVPSHALESEKSLMSFGMGLDMDTLVPALTALWSQFTQAPFSCDKLVAMQDTVKQQNPAMLQMFLGMAQGVKGFGFSLFNISMDQSMGMPSDVSFITSVASAAPEALAAMTSMIPLPDLNGIVIPADGIPIEIAVPMLPPSVKLKAAIKGKHLVVYSGTEGEAAANALTAETLDANGVYGIGLNYRKFGEIMELVTMNSPLASAGSCIDAQEMRHVMTMTSMNFSVLVDFDTDGVNTHFDGYVDKPSAQDFMPSGTYNLKFLEEDCSWISAGTEEFKSDGTGEIKEVYEDVGCTTFESSHEWKKQGSTLVVSNAKERTREECESPWEESQEPSHKCHLINIQGDTFQCLFDPGTEDAMLYRYSKAG